MSRLFYLSLLLILVACQEQSTTSSAPTITSYTKISGITMGVIRYNITYYDEQKRVLQPVIDSLLGELNMGSSTYEPKSTISQFNQSTTGITVENKGFAKHFIKNVLIAKDVAEKTDGYFDPTVAPLVNYYGFGNKGKGGVEKIDTAKVLGLLTTVGFDKISIHQDGNQVTIGKNNPNTQLDFSAIAKGYAIDEVSVFLQQKNITNYLVEIGGEVRASGKNRNGNDWKIAIRKPAPEASEGYFMETPLLANLSMATSGNYENYRVVEGEKIGHTMNPKTGFPELNPLLSASVFADDCIIADSYATAFMAMGMEKAFNLAEELSEIEAYLVYFNENGKIVSKYTQGLEGVINQ